MATKAEIEKEFEAFKKLVKETTLNYDGGCPAGKRDFLRQLDLADKVGGTFRVTFEYRVDEGDVDEYEDYNGEFDPEAFFDWWLECRDVYSDYISVVPVK